MFINQAHPLILRPGMTVHISQQAIRVRNQQLEQEYKQALLLLPEHKTLRYGRLYRITEKISLVRLTAVSTGNDAGWFSPLDLMPVIAYQGYTIIGKLQHQWKEYHALIDPIDPWVAEIYTPDGAFITWEYSPLGFWATMRDAVRQIDAHIERAISQHELEQDCDRDGYSDDDPDWHEQELWGREDY